MADREESRMMHGAVLAGGDSRRMGSDKSGIIFQGEPLWRRQIRILREAGAGQVVLVRRPGQSVPAGVTCLRDTAVDTGPLAGLHAALSPGSAAFIAVLAVDMPGIDAAWFRWLLGFCRPGMGAMARHGEICEPLAAIYPAEALAEITARIERRDLSLQRLALDLAAAGRMTLLPLSAAAAAQTASINTSEELKSAQASRAPVPDDLIAELRAAGLVAGEAARLAPLAGGVSSEIFLVEDGARRFVVKRALAKLRVRDDWFADMGRNRVEREFFAYASRVVPGAVPRVLHADGARGWFAMEFLGDELLNWKTELLAGRADPGSARMAGATLGRLHAASWGDPEAREKFATLRNFTDLRIAPYLLTAAERVPDLRGLLEKEAARLAATQLALVHGDYSPKNLLVAPGCLVVLDAETAWFGDPAFDTGFLLNHLYLKALHHAAAPEPFLTLVGEAWRAYAGALGGSADAEIEERTIRLTLCLMLARVHGKSPAEYLGQPARTFITDFVHRHLPRPPGTISALSAAWRAGLGKLLPT